MPELRVNPFTVKELKIPVPGTLLYRISGFDQFINSWIGNGNNDQTFSARCWEAEGKLGGRWRFIRRLVDLLFWFEKRHCEKSYWVNPDRLTYPKLKFIKVK